MTLTETLRRALESARYYIDRLERAQRRLVVRDMTEAMSAWEHDNREALAATQEEPDNKPRTKMDIFELCDALEKENAQLKAGLATQDQSGSPGREEREKLETELYRQYNTRLRGPDGGIQIFKNEIPALAEQILASLRPPAPCVSKDDEIEQLREQLRHDWQPMETAPKDGTRVLLSFFQLPRGTPNGRNVVIGRWTFIADRTSPTMRSEKHWVLDYGSRRHYGPNGWMPLPEQRPAPFAGQREEEKS